MEQESTLVGVKVAMERHMESLHKQAMDVVEAYYGFKNEMNRRMDWSKKSSLMPRVRRRCLSIAAEVQQALVWQESEGHAATVYDVHHQA